MTAQVTIPLATVTDRPDLAERGLWGGSANRDIVWMSQHKMNLVESHVELRVTDAGRGRAVADQELIDLSRRHALKFVPRHYAPQRLGPKWRVRGVSRTTGPGGVGPCTRRTQSL